MDFCSSGFLGVFTLLTCIFNPPKGMFVCDIICIFPPCIYHGTLIFGDCGTDPFWGMDSGESSSVTLLVMVAIALSETLRVGKGEAGPRVRVFFLRAHSPKLVIDQSFNFFFLIFFLIFYFF